MCSGCLRQCSGLNASIFVADPGSGRIVTIGAPHCGLSVGPVILVDNRLDRRTAKSMTNITPELGYPGMSPHRSGRTFGYFKDPYPLSEKLFHILKI